MIHDVDETLRVLARRDILNGSSVEVTFEAPTKDWSTRRNTPTLNLYLYDIHEDLERRETQTIRVRDDAGHVIETRQPARKFKLSYLVTAWTQRPEDEHRLLAAVLGCFLAFDAIPDEVRQGELVDYPYPLRVTIGLPMPKDRSISDVWSALGGELKPSLDLNVTLPMETGRRRPFGPPVLEEVGLRMYRQDGDASELASETVHRGAPVDDKKRKAASTAKPHPGRRLIVHEIERNA